MSALSALNFRMPRTMTRLGAALGLALVAFAASPAQATTILFDPDGAGGANGTYSIAGLDWNAGNALAIGSRNEILRVAGGGAVNPNAAFTTIYQASLQGFTSPSTNIAGLNGTVGTAGAFEITIVAQFNEYVTGASFSATQGTASFALSPNQTGAFFEIYYRDLSAPGAQKSSDQNGTNFRNGTLILSGTPDAGIDNLTNFTSLLNTNVQIDANNASDTRRTVRGSGSALLNAIVGSTDSNFFKNDVKVISTEFNTNLKLNFAEVAAANNFAFYAGGYTPDNAGGQINGLTSNDFQFQADANMSFVLAPEPGTVVSAIGGLLLTSVGMVIRRRKTA